MIAVADLSDPLVTAPPTMCAICWHDVPPTEVPFVRATDDGVGVLIAHGSHASTATRLGFAAPTFATLVRSVVAYAPTFGLAMRLADRLQIVAYRDGYGVADYGHAVIPTAVVGEVASVIRYAARYAVAD